MPEFVLINIKDGDTEDEVVEALLAALNSKGEYDREWDESMVNRHPAGTSEGGQFAPKDGGESSGRRVTEGSKGKLTEEQKAVRAKAVKLLEGVGRNWIHNKTGGDREPTRRELADMMRFLGEKYADQVNALVNDFDDYGKYPDRPSVHLIVGEKNVPDVWLLGWRENEKGLEATPIHDHGPSEAGVYVFKGAVNERIFAIDKADVGQDEIEFREVDRGLDKGGAITINAPYLHDIGAEKGAGTSVTIHAYYPPLNDMNFYEVRGSKLVKTGTWKEAPEEMRKKGFFERDHVFPCFHYSTKKYHDPNVAERIVEYHTPGGHDHDQSTHGNWAHGQGEEHPKDAKGRWVDTWGVLHGGTLDNGPLPQESGGTSEGGQRQLPGVPRKPASIISAARQKTKTYLGGASVQEESGLGGGANETLRLTLDTPDGPMDAVFKPLDGESPDMRPDIPGDYYLREAAASEIAEVVGLESVVPPVVVREIDGRIGSLHEYRNDELTVAKHANDPFDMVANDTQIARVAAFDYLIGNQDRHNGNWLVNENNGDFVLIDHGLAFPEANGWGIRSNFLVNVRDKDLLVREGIDDSWDNKWPEIERVLRGKSLGADVVERTKERYDELVEAKNNGAAFGDLNLNIQVW